MSGFVYAFINESMPCIYKIGETSRPVEERLKEANKSDTFRPPHPYKVFAYVPCEDFKEKEKIIHQLLRDQRINPNREFFKVDNKTIINIFTLIGTVVRPLVKTYESENEFDEFELEDDGYEEEENEEKEVILKITPCDPTKHLDEFLELCDIQPNINEDNTIKAPTELVDLKIDYVKWCLENKEQSICSFGKEGRAIRDHMIERQRQSENGLCMGTEFCINGTPEEPRFNYVYRGV
jgi:hypothetical protein